MGLAVAIPALAVAGAGLVLSVPMRALSFPAALSVGRVAAGAAVSSTATAVGLYLLFPSGLANNGSCPDPGDGGILLLASLGVLSAVLAAVAVGASIRTRRERPVTAILGLVVALVYVAPVLVMAVGLCGD